MHHPQRRIRTILDQPEFNIALFGFLVNLPWEFLQVPFFRRMATAMHWPAVKDCTAAAAGDAVILVVAFWLVAAAAGTRTWMMELTWARLLGFLAIGLLVTIAIEGYATAVGRWEYSEAMPVAPILQVGAVPLLQWLVLPPFVVWLVRRQIG
jgi:hypothetical protein